MIVIIIIIIIIIIIFIIILQPHHRLLRSDGPGDGGGDGVGEDGDSSGGDDGDDVEKTRGAMVLVGSCCPVRVFSGGSDVCFGPIFCQCFAAVNREESGRDLGRKSATLQQHNNSINSVNRRHTAAAAAAAALWKDSLFRSEVHLFIVHIYYEN